MILYEMIVAMNEENVIGITCQDGKQKIPWKLPEDMRRFREITMGHILIMGRKTYESLPNGCPLYGRTHVVLTRYPERYQNINGVVYFVKEEEYGPILERLVAELPGKRVFVCGGSEIYKQFFDKCAVFHVTMVYKSVVQEDDEQLIFFEFPNTEPLLNITPAELSPIMVSKGPEGLTYEFGTFSKLQ